MEMEWHVEESILLQPYSRTLLALADTTTHPPNLHDKYSSLG
jgi:hypothetical protein